MPILATSVKTLVSAQLTGFGWMTIDGGGYCGGDSQSPAYRETQLRWMQLSYVKFRKPFLYFDHFELNVRGYTQA